MPGWWLYLVNCNLPAVEVVQIVSIVSEAAAWEGTVRWMDTQAAWAHSQCRHWTAQKPSAKITFSGIQGRKITRLTFTAKGFEMASMKTL